MKVPLKKNQYVKQVTIDDDSIDIEFGNRKKVALLFISLGANYWPYFKQVLEDCKKNFLPHHKVDYFLWTDMEDFVDPQVTVLPTDFVQWPAPTLMRYHLFLNEEEKLKEYDYVFYLDADMRVVQKISDEILGEGLTVAEHPMYSLRPNLIPPYEPNRESTAYIPRLGHVVNENGKPRFRPLYLAGGFQGGKSRAFIASMRRMKANIDKDFNKNYTAIWNDESHWNKEVFDHHNPAEGHPTIVLGPEYIHPDSLIKEYYEPIWGRKLDPKIYTLTKPFSLSKEGGQALSEMVAQNGLPCPACGDMVSQQGYKIIRIVQCTGKGKAHQAEMQQL